MRPAYSLVLLFFACLSCQSTSSEPIRASNEQPAFLLFTGSSSIRLWKSLEQDFPGYQTANTGFGGSQYSDLLRERDSAIYRYAPDVLFIYEGDNDLALGKTVNEVMTDAETLLADVRDRLPRTHIVIVSAKPSPTRWHLREHYEVLNAALRRISEEDEKLHFADVWTPMLRADGDVRGDIFIADSLHMNPKGYQLWCGVLRDVLVHDCGVLPVEIDIPAKAAP